MSSLSRCAADRKCPPVLPIGPALKLMMVFAVLLAFAVAHLHLRFSLDDLQGETIRLQSYRNTLLSEVRAIESQNEALKQSERLADFARHELGMVPSNPARREMLEVPENLYAGYALARATHRTSRAGEIDMAQAPAVDWMGNLGEKVGLIGEALAQEMQE